MRVQDAQTARFPGDRILTQTLRTNVFAMDWPHSPTMNSLAPGIHDPGEHGSRLLKRFDGNVGCCVGEGPNPRSRLRTVAPAGVTEKRSQPEREWGPSPDG